MELEIEQLKDEAQERKSKIQKPTPEEVRLVAKDPPDELLAVGQQADRLPPPGPLPPPGHLGGPPAGKRIERYSIKKWGLISLLLGLIVCYLLLRFIF